MSTVTLPKDGAFHLKEEPHHPEGSSTMLGFWIYLMSDCLIFAVLFATYAVLGTAYAAGPGPKELFDLNLIAINTAMLLFSSITYGFAMLAMAKNNSRQVIGWLLVTAVFGMIFLGIEIYEFQHLIGIGAGPQRSAYLSAFFLLVGTHGLHVTFGLMWLFVMVSQIRKFGLTGAVKRRLNCLSLFWHFLDVIWIGVFSFVYLVRMI